jgi:hypothetical protein
VQMKKDGQNWKFLGSEAEVDGRIVRSMVERGFVEELTGGHVTHLIITPAGKRALFQELDSIIDRTVARWSNLPEERGESSRRR